MCLANDAGETGHIKGMKPVDGFWSPASVNQKSESVDEIDNPGSSSRHNESPNESRQFLGNLLLKNLLDGQGDNDFAGFAEESVDFG